MSWGDRRHCYVKVKGCKCGLWGKVEGTVFRGVSLEAVTGKVTIPEYLKHSLF